MFCNYQIYSFPLGSSWECWCPGPSGYSGCSCKYQNQNYIIFTLQVTTKVWPLTSFQIMHLYLYSYIIFTGCLICFCKWTHELKPIDSYCISFLKGDRGQRGKVGETGPKGAQVSLHTTTKQHVYIIFIMSYQQLKKTQQACHIF